jgi:streptogramin lyase
VSSISQAVFDKHGNMLFTDQNNFAVRMVNFKSQTVTTLAGGESGFQNGSFADARFRHCVGIVCAPDGLVYVCDVQNHQIRCLDLQKEVVTTLCGKRQGYADGVGDAASFNWPYSLLYLSFLLLLKLLLL